MIGNIAINSTIAVMGVFLSHRALVCCTCTRVLYIIEQMPFSLVLYIVLKRTRAMTGPPTRPGLSEEAAERFLLLRNVRRENGNKK